MMLPDAPDFTTALRRLDLQALLRGAREIEILHAGRIYRLRLTSQGKLILTA